MNQNKQDQAPCRRHKNDHFFPVMRAKPEVKMLQRRLFVLVLNKMAHRSRARVKGCLEAICDDQAYVDGRHRSNKIKAQERICSRKHNAFASKVAEKKLGLGFLDDCYYHDGLIMGYRLIDEALNRATNKQKS